MVCLIFNMWYFIPSSSSGCNKVALSPVLALSSELPHLPVPHLLDLPDPPLPLLQLPLLPGSPLLDGLPPGAGAVLPLVVESLVAPVTEVVTLVFVQTLRCHLVVAASHLIPAEK